MGIYTGPNLEFMSCLAKHSKSVDETRHEKQVTEVDGSIVVWEFGKLPGMSGETHGMRMTSVDFDNWLPPSTRAEPPADA